MSAGEDWPEVEILTDRQASAITREWIDNRIEKPAGFSRSQTRWLMDELGQLCIVETLRRREGESDHCARLDCAWDIVHGIRYTTAPIYATEIYCSDEDKPHDEEQERIEKDRHVVWLRKDPLRAYREGYESPFQTSFSAVDFAHIVADYLERSWLRHPFLDWIIVDITVSRELCSFGEELKKQWLPGRRDFLGLHHRYFEAHGNLKAMTKVDWNEVFGRWNAWFWGSVGFPIGAIWAAFHFQYDTIGNWLLGIYVSVVLIALILWLLRLGRRLFRRISGKTDPRKTDPRAKLFELWMEMYEVWRRLEGPIVNPQRVRDAMQASAEKGAVWDNSTWSIIDRVISLNPAVWVPHPRRD